MIRLYDIHDTVSLHPIRNDNDYTNHDQHRPAHDNARFLATNSVSTFWYFLTTPQFGYFDPAISYWGLCLDSMPAKCVATML